MAEIVAIDLLTDPRIEPYRDIRERDLVGRRGLFIAEGEVVIRKFLAGSPQRPRSLLVDRARLPRLTDLIERLPPGVPIYAAPREILDAIAGFPLHRGMLALGERMDDLALGDLFPAEPAPALGVLAVGIANHDNMGGIFRNAAAFGADAVLVDATCCDPLYRKAIRVSVGAALTVRFTRLTAGADLIATLAAARLTPIALATDGATDIADFRPPSRAALIVGAEGPGLPRTLLDQVTTVRIPMSDGFDSLNVATSTGIALHHLRTAGRNWPR